MKGSGHTAVYKTMIKITKFGGSSVANAEQFRKVKHIIESDDARRFVVISAAGKADKEDNKITDLLYLCHAHVEYHVDYHGIFDIILKYPFRLVRLVYIGICRVFQCFSGFHLIQKSVFVGSSGFPVSLYRFHKSTDNQTKEMLITWVILPKSVSYGIGMGFLP